MGEELNLQEIKNKINRKFELGFYIKGNKLITEKLNGYIDSDDRYEEIEEDAIIICDYIIDEFDCSCSFEILDEGYELAIEIF